MNEQYMILSGAVSGVALVASVASWLWCRRSCRSGGQRDMTLNLRIEWGDAQRLFPSAVSDNHEADRREADENSGDGELATIGADEVETKRFVLDSLTLLTCYTYLFGDASTDGWPGRFREVFAYLSSVRIAEHTYILTNLLPVRFAEQSAGGVTVDQASNIDTFTALDRLGLTVGAHLHSHPGQSGPNSTYPSETDRRFQRRLEQGGCPAIGLIFARCRDGFGYVRFFGGEESPFTVDIQGTFVERMEDHVYRLCLDNGQLPLNTVVVS